MAIVNKIVPYKPTQDQICDFWIEFDKYIDSLNDEVIYHLPALITPDGQKSNIVRRKSKIIVWVNSAEAAEAFITKCEYISNGRAAFNIQTELIQGDISFSKKRAVKSKIVDVDEFIDVLESEIKIDQFHIRENEEFKMYQKNTDQLERDIFKRQIEIGDLKDNIETISEWSKANGKSKIVLRKSSGDSYRISFFEPTIARRKQINLGDLLIVIADNKPNLIDSGKRKHRSDSAVLSREYICDTKFGDVYDVKSEA